MNKKIYLLPLLLLALIFVSCEETKEATKFDNWRARNEGYIDSLKTVFDEKTDPELKAFEPEINPKLRIYYKKKISNDTGAIPLYTDSVNVFYRGSFIFGETFDQNFTGADPGPFDSPTKFVIQTFITVGGVSGWAEILQRMRVGERWLVYIPWELAYGASGTDDIPGYSTLILMQWKNNQGGFCMLRFNMQWFYFTK